MAKYSKQYSPKKTPQTQPIPGRESEMVKNSAGGFTFAIDKWARFERFLILGTDGGTYYARGRKLLAENAKNIKACIAEDGERAVDLIVDVSVGGRAPTNSEALFALALCGSTRDVVTRRMAFAALPKVARIPTHLFEFVEYLQEHRGWGHLAAKSVRDWYNKAPLDRLAYHMVKYRSRGSWSHRDMLRVAHPRPPADRENLYGWATGTVHREDDGMYVKTNKDRRGEITGVEMLGENAVAPIVEGFERVQRSKTVKETVALIEEYRLPWEALPTTMHNEPDVWMAMLPGMPATALIRNLNRLAKLGLTDPFSSGEDIVVSKLENDEWLRASRVHPLKVLVALSVYKDGRSPSRKDVHIGWHAQSKGDREWNPNRAITEALEQAFHKTFANVEPTNRKYGLFLDVSGSMTWVKFGGTNLMPRDASAALSLVTLATEPKAIIGAFSGGIKEINIPRTASIGAAINAVNDVPPSRTDCSLPMLWALQRKIDLDVFVVYTDNETWAGMMHPVQALKKYRSEINPNAKLIVVGMTATRFSIADPNDGGMLDIVGFDTNIPQIMSNFVVG